MKLSRVFLPASVVAFGFFVTTVDVSATPEMTKKEKTACATCHVEKMPKKANPDLNKVGGCYKKTPDLAKCKQ